MAGKTLIPPEFTDDRPYEDWSRRVTWWKRQTELSADKQGAALASSFKGKALDAVLELNDDVINSATGVTAIMDKLDILFKKNTLTKKIEDIEKFEKHYRDEHKSVKDFVAEFDKYYNKLKTHKIVYPEDIKGYKLLKGARLQSNEEKLIRATIKDITYDEVVQKLKDVYGEDKPTNSFNIKTESTFYTRTETPADYEEEEAEDYDHFEEQDEANDTFYTPQQRRNNFHSQNFRPNRQQQFTQRRTTSPTQHQNARPQGAASSNWRNSKPGSPPIHPQTRNRGKTLSQDLGLNQPAESATVSTIGRATALTTISMKWHSSLMKSFSMQTMTQCLRHSSRKRGVQLFWTVVRQTQYVARRGLMSSHHPSTQTTRKRSPTPTAPNHLDSEMAKL